jgi:hypothetical protein
MDQMTRARLDAAAATMKAEGILFFARFHDMEFGEWIILIAGVVVLMVLGHIL